MGIMRRIGLAWAALTGGFGDIKAGGQTDIAAELEGVRMDLKGREDEIARLRKEFSLKERQADTDVSKAADDAILGLMRRIGPLLSQIATMRSMTEEGGEARPRDILTLFGKIEKALYDAGLHPIGSVGEIAAFDSRIHQRMSGGDVKDGSPVRIRFVGYIYGDTVITKGMVSRTETGME